MENNPNIKTLDNAEDEIDFRELLQALWHGKWLLLTTTSLFSIVAIIYSLSLPNIYQSSSIAFMTKLPKQLNFAIDYELQFEKSFVEPLNYIIEKINWNVDRSYGTAGNLEDFFV